MTRNPRTVRLPALWLDGAWHGLGSERSHSTHPGTLRRWQWSEDMAPQSGHLCGAQQAGRSAGPGWRDQDSAPRTFCNGHRGSICWVALEMSSTRPGAASVHGVWRPLPAAVWHQGPQTPLARLTAITWRLMASLGQLLRGQGNRRELQVLQLVGPELQKVLTKIRSFCKLTHQDRDAPPSQKEQDGSQAGR